MNLCRCTCVYQQQRLGAGTVGACPDYICIYIYRSIYPSRINLCTCTCLYEQQRLGAGTMGAYPDGLGLSCYLFCILPRGSINYCVASLYKRFSSDPGLKVRHLRKPGQN